MTDVTEFKVGGEKLYLSPILDLYNSEVIAFNMTKRPVFSLVSQMLQEGFKRLNASEQPIMHSDQGWQYQMKAYQNMLKEHGITQSMSRKGNCLDNAVIENFFGILKSECFYTKRFDSIDELETEISNYIEYYNHDRIKLKLKGLSPIQYRVQSNLAA